MKHIGNTIQKLAVLFAVSILLFVAGCATLEQNIAESKKEYIIPSKEIHIVDMINSPFCEIGLINWHVKVERRGKHLEHYVHEPLSDGQDCRDRVCTRKWDLNPKKCEIPPFHLSLPL